MKYLDKVIAKKIELGCIDRQDALEDIRKSFDNTSPYQTAKFFGVLDENESAEDFAIEFMTAYNNEIWARY